MAEKKIAGAKLMGKAAHRTSLLLGSFGLLVFLVLIGFLLLTQLPVNQKLSGVETTAVIANPNRGWYVTAGYPQGGSGSLEESDELRRVCEELKENGETLIGFHIRLHDMMSGDGTLSADSLNGLWRQFEYLREQGIQAVVRPVYDEDGRNQPEPQLDLILTHVDQLGPVFAQFQDVILTVQLGYLGAFGEWHSGKYDTEEARREVLQHSLNSSGYLTQFSLRCPRFYRELFGVEQPVAKAESRNYSGLGRVGFYNDGYLGSESDLGTYTTWTREQELAFQEQHNRYTPFGGEAVLLTEYGELFRAIEDMERTHCTYLNKTHDLSLKDRWKEEIYQGEQARNQEYVGQTGYKYIQDHLGYRLVVREAALPKLVVPGISVTTRVKVENTGFGNIVKPCMLELLWEKDGEVISQKLTLDPRDWNSGEITDVDITVTASKKLKKGTWNVLFRVTNGIFEAKDAEIQPDFQRIRFANEEGWNDVLRAQKVGSVTVL